MSFLLLVAACGSSSPNTDSKSAASKHYNITIGAGGIGLNQLPIYVGVLKGYFAKQGLTVKIDQVGADVVTVLVAGQSQLASVGVGSALPPVQQGKATSIIYDESGDDGGAYFGALASVKSPTDCKRVVTAPQGTAGYAWAALYKAELHASYDIIGTSGSNSSSTMLPSVLAGTNDCMVTGLSNFGTAFSTGKMHLLINPAKAGSLPAGTPLVAETGLFGLTSWLDTNRPAVDALMAGLYQAEQYVNGASSSAVATLLLQSRDFQTFTAAQLTELVSQDRAFMTPDNGLISSSMWTGELKWLNYSLPYVSAKAKEWSYSQRVDMSFYKDGYKATSS
jgi:ABC-type nitrate/sulfonate/bicarbonate transport system substrate-binding protein